MNEDKDRKYDKAIRLQISSYISICQDGKKCKTAFEKIKYKANFMQHSIITTHNLHFL